MPRITYAPQQVVAADVEPFFASFQEGERQPAGWEATGRKAQGVRQTLGAVEDVAKSPLTALALRGGQEYVKERGRKSRLAELAAERLQHKRLGVAGRDLGELEPGAPPAQPTEAELAGEREAGQQAATQGWQDWYGQEALDDQRRAAEALVAQRKAPAAADVVTPQEAVKAPPGSPLAARMARSAAQEPFESEGLDLAKLARERLGARTLPEIERVKTGKPEYGVGEFLSGVRGMSDRGVQTPQRFAGLGPGTAEEAAAAGPPSGPAETAAPQPPRKPRTIGEASDRELEQVAANLRVAIARYPGEAKHRQRLASVEAEIQDRARAVEERGLEGAAPVEMTALVAEARKALTPEAQAAVMEKVARVQAPITSLEDLISDEPEKRLRDEVSKHFPAAAKKTPEEIAAGVALDYSKSEREKAEATYKRERGPAQAEADRARAERQRALATESPAKIAEREARAKKLDAEAQTIGNQRDALLARIKADTDRMKALAEKARRARAVGKGGGVTKDDLPWVKEANDRGRERVTEAARVAEAAEKADAQARNNAETARLRAEMAATQVGAPPQPPAKTGDDDNDVRADIAYRRELADHAKRKELAGQAEKTAVTADATQAKYAVDLEAARALHTEALKAGDTDRALADEIMRFGIGKVRTRLNAATPAAQPAASIDQFMPSK